MSYDYHLIKEKPCLEEYISNSDSYVSRIILKLRIGSNALFGSQLRYLGIQREERLCPLCNLSVEDTLHFCSHCPALQNERQEYLSSIIESVSVLSNWGDKVLARIALGTLSDVDLMRLLLCSSNLLSFSCWNRFSIWFKLISAQIFKHSFKTIYKMYTRRLTLVYPEGLNSNSLS